MPRAAGQNEGPRWRHRELITTGAVDIVQPNVVYVGGYTEALKVAHMAQAFNLPVANGGGGPHARPPAPPQPLRRPRAVGIALAGGARGIFPPPPPVPATAAAPTLPRS